MEDLKLQDVLWRHGEWRCEYWTRPFKYDGAARLYIRSVLAAARHVETTDEMRWISRHWEKVIKSLHPTVGELGVEDRRALLDGRRPTRPGGRRHGDPPE
jgi:hypothetical protein